MSISLPVALCVLLAALLHATWNALLKNATDKFLNATLISAACIPLSIVVLLIFPFPDAASWPYIGASIIVHIAYFLLLAKSYEHGDLSQSYMLIRGLAPPLVALGAFIFAGETLPPFAWAGIGLVSFGLINMSDFSGKTLSSKALLFSIATAFMIVTYTLLDGFGVRLGGSPLSYIAILSTAQGSTLVLLALYTRRKAALSYARTYWKIGFFAGWISFAAYSIVLWAITQAPIGIVSALRETSVIYATLIGVLFFKEGFGKKRIISALLVCLGAVLIKL